MVLSNLLPNILMFFIDAQWQIVDAHLGQNKIKINPCRFHQTERSKYLYDIKQDANFVTGRGEIHQ